MQLLTNADAPQDIMAGTARNSRVAVGQLMIVLMVVFVLETIEMICIVNARLALLAKLVSTVCFKKTSIFKVPVQWHN